MRIQRYVNIAILNLIIVAAFGLLMRYKIAFEFPFFNQKFLQHAHSHFAFAGWITHTLFIMMIKVLSHEVMNHNFAKYRFIVNANLVCAYGMLIFFTLQGYEPASIFFSTASILVSFAFAGFYYYDTSSKKINFPGHSWFRAGLFFAIISAAGTFMLAYIMSTKQSNLDLYLSSVYYYLHFQYNGWFFFACMGLFTWKINRLLPEYQTPGIVYRLFVLSCIPAYFLSVLWLDLPVWLFVIIIIAAVMQVSGFYIFCRNIQKVISQLKNVIPKSVALFFLFAAIALSIKLMLQFFSTIPEISKLAFGFRTIVIAYLHLVLLAFVSVFILTYMFLEGSIRLSSRSITAMIIITSGIFLNEFILLVQGVSSFSYTLVPYANEGLVVVSAIIFIGLIMLLLSNISNKKQTGINRKV